MFVVMYDLRAMPAGHQTFLRQRTFSVPVRRDPNNQTSRKPLSMGQGRTLRYLVHLRWDSAILSLSSSTDDSPPLFILPFFLYLPLPSQTGSRALSLGRSTSTVTSVCCFPGSPWRSTAVLLTSFNPSQSCPWTHPSLTAAEARLSLSSTEASTHLDASVTLTRPVASTWKKK